MNLLNFFNHVNEAEDLEGLGIDRYQGEQTGFEILHIPTHLVTYVASTTVEKLDWPQLHAVFTGHREPKVLKHMTRVVGYYSQVGNWNVSKVGELKDRQRGVYTVAEPTS